MVVEVLVDSGDIVQEIHFVGLEQFFQAKRATALNASTQVHTYLYWVKTGY